ncbi:hypothetical protein Tco_0003696 [Tanacetum coccineum]
MSHIRAKFESIDFDCLLKINEQIVPRFVLEFYRQLTFDYNSRGHFVVNFVIQSKSFSLTLEEFGQILKIPFKGQVSHTDMWSLDYLSISVPSKGRYIINCEMTLKEELRYTKSFHSNSSSQSQNVSSSSNVVPRVRQNSPHESHNLNTYLSETINLQTQQRDAHREGLRSIGQALRNMMGGKQK